MTIENSRVENNLENEKSRREYDECILKRLIQELEFDIIRMKKRLFYLKSIQDELKRYILLRI